MSLAENDDGVHVILTVEGVAMATQTFVRFVYCRRGRRPKPAPTSPPPRSLMSIDTSTERQTDDSAPHRPFKLWSILMPLRM